MICNHYYYQSLCCPVCSLVFVPAIIDRNGLNRRQEKKHYRRCRRIIKWNKFYNGYITFTQKRKWIYITILVLAFGIPLNLLPQKLDQPYYLYGNKGKPELNGTKCYTIRQSAANFIKTNCASRLRR